MKIRCPKNPLKNRQKTFSSSYSSFSSFPFPRVHLFVLLRSEPGVGVGYADVKLLGAFEDQLALLGGDCVSDLSSVDTVLHQQNLQVRHVIDQEFLESVRANVFCCFSASITDVGHLVLTLEPTTDSVVNTL